MRFAWKVFLGTVAVVAVTTFVVEHQVVSAVEQQRLQSIRQRVADDARLLADLARPPLLAGDEPALTALAGHVSEMLAGRRVTLIAADGRVLADSHEDPDVMDNHGMRPEILAPGTIHERQSHTLHRRMLYYALAIEDGAGTRRGYVRIALASEDVQAEVSDLRQAIQAGALLALVVGCLLAVLFALRVSRPLGRITRVVLSLARGDYEQRLAAGGSDEIGRLASAVDVLAGRLAERDRRLGAEVAQKDAILAAMEEGVLALDQDERIRLVNETARFMLSCGRTDPVGRRLSGVCRSPELLAAAQACLEGRQRVVDEFDLDGPEGEQVLLVTATPVQEPGALAVIVLHDLTDIRRLETVRKDFVANVSHEMKTPLTAMRGFLEMVVEDPDMPGKQRQDFLERVRVHTDRLAAIVTDLLELARIEAEPGTRTTERLDLSDVADGCVTRARAQAEARGVLLALEPHGEPLDVMGQEDALASAVDNLVGNAISYSPAGQTVTVRLRRDGDQAVIEVQDRGIGIPGHEQERIFERFYRVDKDRSRRLGGTGLGLSIVRHVARSHGGEVTVVSAPGRGSTFALRLPSAPPASPAARAAGEDRQAG